MEQVIGGIDLALAVMVIGMAVNFLKPVCSLPETNP
jgi:hypothetical protein